MRKKLEIPNNLHINSVIIPKISSNQRNKNLLISPKPISVSIRRNINNINTRKKETKKSKNIFHNILYDKENENTLKNENINKNKIKKFLDTNDYNILKKNLEVVKFELNILNKKIKNNKISLEQLMKNLSELNANEIEQKQLLQNYIFKNESLEEMKKNLINKIKNKKESSDYDENYNINVTLEELLINKKESFIEQVFQIFNEINNISNKKYYNIYKIIIEKSYMELISERKNQSLIKNNNLVDNFFVSISKLISQSNSNEKVLVILLSILVKKNIISDKINKIVSSFDSDYKIKNAEYNKKIKKLENKLILLQIKQNELVELKNKIIEKIEKEKEYSPFCGRTIKQKSFNKKNILINSSSINFSTEFINKMNSNDFNNNNKSLNNINNKTERNSIDKRKRNLIMNINAKNKREKYHSNKISVNKIDLNGIFPCFKDKKEKYYETSINTDNIKTDRGIFNNKIQNSLTNNYGRNKVIKLIKGYGRNNHNLTKSYNDLYLSKLNRFNTNSNKKIIEHGNIFNSKDKSYNNLNILKVNNYNKGKQKRIQTEKVRDNLLKDLINGELKEKKIINDNINSVFKKPNNILTINSNLFYKRKIKLFNVKKWKQQLNEEQRIKSSEKQRKVNKKIKLIFEQSDENLSLKKRENSFMSYKIVNNINSYKTKFDNSMKSFCYYKFLDKNSSMFNPLENNIDFKNSDYNEGLISIDDSTNSIKIGQIRTSQNDTMSLTKSQSIFNYSNGGLDIISIEFKNITNVYMNELMKNIVKIHDIFIKYNSNKNKEKEITDKNASLNINKILNLREIMFINDLSQEEKIKASLCNFFSFILE